MTTPIFSKLKPVGPFKLADASDIAETADALLMTAAERAAIPALGLDIEAEAESREAALNQEAQNRDAAISTAIAALPATQLIKPMATNFRFNAGYPIGAWIGSAPSITATTGAASFISRGYPLWALRPSGNNFVQRIFLDRVVLPGEWFAMRFLAAVDAAPKWSQLSGKVKTALAPVGAADASAATMVVWDSDSVANIDVIDDRNRYIKQVFQNTTGAPIESVFWSIDTTASGATVFINTSGLAIGASHEKPVGVSDVDDDPYKVLAQAKSLSAEASARVAAQATETNARTAADSALQTGVNGNTASIGTITDQLTQTNVVSTIGVSGTPISGTKLLAGTEFIYADPVHEGFVQQVRNYAPEAGTFTLTRWSKAGSVITKLGHVDVPIAAAGAVTLDQTLFTNLGFAEGDLPGFYGPRTSCYTGSSAGSADGSGWYGLTGAPLADGASATVGAPTTAGKLQVAIVIAKKTFVANAPAVAALNKSAASLVGDGLVTLGTKSAPVAGTVAASGSYIYSTPMPQDVELSAFEIWLHAATYYAVEVWTRAGDMLNRTYLSAYVNIEDSIGRKKMTAGQLIDPATGKVVVAPKGSYLGFSAPNGSFDYTPGVAADDDGWWQAPYSGGGAGSGTLNAPIGTQQRTGKLQACFRYKAPTQRFSVGTGIVGDMRPGFLKFVAGLMFGGPPTPFIVGDGNSLMHGVQGGTSWMTMMSDDLGFDLLNFGIPGEATSTMTTNAPTKIDPYVATAVAAGQMPILFVQEMVNDLLTHGDPAGAVANMATYCNARRAAGWKVGVFNLAAAGAQAAYPKYTPDMRDTVNNLMDAQWPNFADFLVDLRVPELSDPTNTTYYAGDKLHYVTPGGRVYYRQGRLALRDYLLRRSLS